MPFSGVEKLGPAFKSEMQDALNEAHRLKDAGSPSVSDNDIPSTSVSPTAQPESRYGTGNKLWSSNHGP